MGYNYFCGPSTTFCNTRTSPIEIPEHPQHVIQRGNNREPIFCQASDYSFYFEKLGDACIKHDCKLHAFVLMNNHTHLLITPNTENGIGKVMQSIGRYYVQYFNYTYQRTGTLWEGGYKATLLDSESYLLTCMRYLELNPVRAGMVSHPRDYQWSSYQSNAQGEANALLSPHFVYQRLGVNAIERQKAYRALFKRRIGDTTLEALREATNKAWVLGNERFRAQISQLTDRPAAPKKRGGDRKSQAYREKKGINRV